VTPPPPYSNAAAQMIAREIRARSIIETPRLAIVLGSGLGGLVDVIRDRVIVPYAEIPGLTDIHVAGQAGELVVGALDDVPVVILAGRFHVYEGHSPKLAGFPVRIAHAMGARTLLVTNAAGGINRSFVPGDFMIITDHLNLSGVSPLTGPQDDGDIRFPDMSDPYDASLRDQLRAAALALGIIVREGVYAGVQGPSYETRAEIKMLQLLGGDAVGMSTIPEVIVARALAMRVAGISCISNMASGVQSTPLDHADVLRMTAHVSTQFQSLVREFVRTMV